MYVQFAKFEVDKHQFKQLIGRNQFKTIGNKRALKHV